MGETQSIKVIVQRFEKYAYLLEFDEKNYTHNSCKTATCRYTKQTRYYVFISEF